MTILDDEIAALPPVLDPALIPQPRRSGYMDEAQYWEAQAEAFHARLALVRRVLQEMVDEFGVEHCGIPNCTHCPVVDDARKVLEGTQ